MKKWLALSMTMLAAQAWGADVKIEKDVTYLPEGRAEKAE
jgi:hypothetical protein